MFSRKPNAFRLKRLPTEWSLASPRSSTGSLSRSGLTLKSPSATPLWYLVVLSDTCRLEDIPHWKHTARRLVERTRWMGPDSRGMLSSHPPAPLALKDKQLPAAIAAVTRSTIALAPATGEKHLALVSPASAEQLQLPKSSKDLRSLTCIL